MQNLMRHMTYTTCQRLDRIYRNSKREYHLFIAQTGCLNLRLPLKRIVDTGANRSVPKAFVPDLMLYILESTMVVTKVRMAEDTFYQSHNELLTTAKIGKQQFLLSFLILKSVVDNVPRSLDFLKEVGPTLPVTVSE
uniref:Uncharacterized protein n=1 Tax=Glossina palpalis gambiensis TaxID=67801 RepID=A0A1B0BJW8_9MUSC